MFTRRMLVPAAIATAIGVPVISSTEFATFTKSALEAGLETSEIDPLAPPEQPELLYLPVQNLGEILRFDVDPNWVVGRWQRVSTAPGSDGLTGLRVALVTGINPWDVCGSLTYFFDSERRLQRIQLAGVTGDAGPLVQILTSQFGFEGHTTTAAGLYTARRSGQVIGLLRLDHAPVLEADEPNRRLALILEVNRPDGRLPLSAATIQLATARPY